MLFCAIGGAQVSWEQPFSAGLVFLAHDDYESALRYFQRAVELNPRDPRAWFQAGFCRGKLGDNEGKIRDYKHAIRLNPRYADPHYSLGISYLLIGQHCDAIREYIALRPLDKDMAEKLGQLLELMSDDPQGETCEPKPTGLAAGQTSNTGADAGVRAG